MAEQRPGLRSLAPYLRQHRSSLLAVAVLSLIRTGGTLLQPLLTRSVLNGITRGPVCDLVCLLFAFLLAVAALDGILDYLLTRTAEGMVLSSRTIVR